MGEARVRGASARTAAGLVLAALALAACADRLPVDADHHRTALPPKGPTYTLPTPAPAIPPADVTPATSPAAKPADTCGAAELAYLVGKPRTEIPIPADLTRRRVVCTTCPVDGEVRPERQTITYDSATNHVTKVSCG